MAETTINSLEDLPAEAAASDAPVHVQKLDAYGRAYSTGKRKNAIARVWIRPGNGSITVNGKEFDKFFARPVLQMILQQPIVAAGRNGQYDINATVSGGGLSGMSSAPESASAGGRDRAGTISIGPAGRKPSRTMPRMVTGTSALITGPAATAVPSTTMVGCPMTSFRLALPLLMLRASVIVGSGPASGMRAAP